MMKGFLILLLVALASAKVYDGYQVWRINVGNKLEADDVNRLVNNFNLDVFSQTKNHFDVLVSPELQKGLKVALSRFRLSYEKTVQDIGVHIKEEADRLAKKPRAFTLDDYNNLDDIESYLTDLDASNDYVTLNSIGQTVEGRDIWQVKISVGAGKPSVWFDCTIHAREWVSGASCLYGIDLLANNYDSNPDVKAVLDKFDIYIIPIANPDGYVFTWAGANGDRLWRKNRSKYPENICYGVDLNRNFDNHFGGEGTSDSACAETYHGPTAASESETQAFQDSMVNLQATADLQVMFSLHSYSQLWMYPFGWTDSLPSNEAQLDALAATGVAALEAVHGTQYDYGSIATTIYVASGSTIDFGYDHGILLGFALELRDKGLFGFELPAAQITPTAEETWAGIFALLEQV